MNHVLATRLAAAPWTTRVGFHDSLRTLARRLLNSTIGLAAPERQFLQDLARPDVRYPMNAMRRLNAIAARSVNAEDREGPAELIRADILAQTERQSCLITTFDRENAANDWADRAQWKLARTITSSTIEECELALTSQLAATREAIDVVRALQPRGRS